MVQHHAHKCGDSFTVSMCYMHGGKKEQAIKNRENIIQYHVHECGAW